MRAVIRGYAASSALFLYYIVYFLISLPNALNHSFIRIGFLAAYFFTSLSTLVLNITF